MRFFHPDLLRDLFDLAAANERRGLGRTDPQCDPLDHIQADRHGETGGFVQSRLSVAGRIALIGKNDDGAGTAGKLAAIAVKSCAQSSADPACSSARFSGRAG
ncbi:hypothetical protein SPKIRA_05180 [Sphingomonas paucimobilis]|nr:hypothetical protein SPKIRA_05180 [Sphingomonas paucimobilis]